MKIAIFSAMSPDLRGRCDFTGRGKASTPAAAISRAVKDFYRQVGRRRVRTIRATITVYEESPVEPVFRNKRKCLTPNATNDILGK